MSEITPTGYVEYIKKPGTNEYYQIRDKVAQEMLVHKTEKKIVDSLPAKPTTKQAWLAMEPFLYYIPIDGQEDEYECWTLFFTVENPTAADYTDPDNYEWAMIGVTNVDLTNFSTKGHTHEVIPEVDVDDHEYTPQGLVQAEFEGHQGQTSSNGTHTHSVNVPAQTITNGTFSGSEKDTGPGSKHKHSIDISGLAVTGSLSGTAGTTGAGSQHRHSVDFPSVSISGTLSGENGTTGAGSQHRHAVDFPSASVSGTLSGTAGTTSSNSGHTHGTTDTKKKLTTTTMKVEAATVSVTPTSEDRATGALEAGNYGNDSVFHGFTVDSDNVLEFDTKLMSKAQTLKTVTASTTATKATIGGSAAAESNMATGALEDGQSGDPLVLTGVSVNQESSHTHGFTPEGTISGTAASGTGYTGYENEHTHGFKPSGSVSGSTGTATGNTGYENEHTHGFTPEGSVSGTGSYSGYTGSEDEHTHKFTPEGSMSITVPQQTIGATGEAGGHQHNVTPTGDVVAGFRGMRANLKHKVDSKKVRTSPDMEDEGSFVFDWYGIRYPENASSRYKERIGNMDMHRMLPIQTKMRRCILGDDGEVKYYLDDRDSTKRAGSQEGYVTSEENFITKVETDEIRDETETIEGIKGKSVAWNQLLDDSRLAASGTTGTISMTFSNHTVTINGTTSSTVFSDAAGGLGNMYVQIINGHKYYLPSNIPVSETYVQVYAPNSGNKTILPNRIHTADFSENALVRIRIAAGTYSNAKFQFQLFDLTLLFGAGNEPTTVEAFESWLLANRGSLGYFPYEAGSILNVNMKGVKTVGFNVWDEEWGNYGFDAAGNKSSNPNQVGSENYIPVVPSKSYCITFGTSTNNFYLFEYDSNKNFVKITQTIASGSIVQMSDSTRYVQFALTSTYGNVYHHDICINISDPKRNGEYEPYNAHTYDLDIPTLTGINPITGQRETMFPRGMKWADNAGTVRDLLYRDNGITKAVKKVGDVDLGSLTWIWIDAEGYTYRRFAAGGVSPSILPVNVSTKANAVCSKYNIFSSGQTYYGSVGLSIDNSSNIIIYDPSYSTPQSFKTAMDGVYLNYELATPITYTDIQDANGNPVILPVELEVEHNGMIEILPQIEPDRAGHEVPMVSPTLTMKKYVLTQGANLDGSDGQVMVEIPEHWRKVYRVTESSVSYVYAKISPYPQEGWHHVKKNYVGAFEASIVDGKLASTSALVDMVLTRNASGKIVATCDLTNSRKPKTLSQDGVSLSVDGFRQFARKRNDNATYEWNGQTWEQWVDVAWLYFIEYATTNSQEPFNIAKDANGFMQGGLGDGFSNFTEWSTYNNYYPVVPCGVTACLGNHSGEVLLTVNNRTLPVNTYRGIELPFSHLWKLTDGIKFNGTTIYRAVNPRDYSNAEGTTGYVEVGAKGSSNGYVTTVKIQKDSGYDERFDGDLTPTGVGGGTTSYYCDYYYQASGWRACLVGGNASYGAYDGFVCVASINELGVASQNCGSRLCFLPEER